MAEEAMPGAAEAANFQPQLDQTANTLQLVFQQFLQTFCVRLPGSDEDRFVYMEEIDRLQATERTSLYVNIQHCREYQQGLGDLIEAEYHRFEPYLKRALFNVIASVHPQFARDENEAHKVFWVCFFGVDWIKKIRQLRTEQIGRLCSMSGTVTRTSEVRPELLVGVFTCVDCRTTVPPVTQHFRYTEPQRCSNEQCPNMYRWELDMVQSRFVDWQRVRVQENPDEIPSGAMPRSVDVILRNEEVEKAKAGDKCCFTGQLVVVPDVAKMSAGVSAAIRSEGKGRGRGGKREAGGGGAAGGGVRGIRGLGVKEMTYRLVFLATYVQTINETAMDATDEDIANQMTQEECDELMLMKSQPDLYTKMVNSVAPRVYGHDDVKRGVLLQLVGGVHKQTSEGIHLRGDVNVCIVGDPSTAKSQFLKYVSEFVPRAVYTSGKSSSAAGLTATVVKDPDSGEFNIEAGALMLADNGICCFDGATPVALSTGVSRRLDEMDSMLLRRGLPVEVLSGGARGRIEAATCTRFIRRATPMRCVELTLEDGRTVLCTPEHRVMSGAGKWQRADTATTVRVGAVCAPLHRDADVLASPWATRTVECRWLDGSVAVRVRLCTVEDVDKAMALARLLGFACGGGDRNRHLMEDVDTRRLLQRDAVLVFGTATAANLAFFAQLGRVTPAFIDDSSCPPALVREFCAARLGACADVARSASPRHFAMRARRECTSTQWKDCCASVRRLDGGHVDDIVWLGVNVGVRYSRLVEARLAVAATVARVQTYAASKEPIDALLRRMGASALFDAHRTRASVSPNDTHFVLRVLQRRETAQRRAVYDLTVPRTTSFLCNGVVAHNCIDEFDKMDLRDQVAIHEAMEQQTISITKAGIQATLNARASVLAAANPIGGRYDRSRTLKANLNIGAALMSRFDLFFVVLDECDDATDFKIAQHIVQVHKGGGHVPDGTVFSKEQMQRYIRFARSLKPTFTSASEKLLVDHYRRLRQQDVVGGGKTAYRITARQLESLIRLSEALARLHLSYEVSEQYVNEAARLLKKSIIQVQCEDVKLFDDEAQESAAVGNAGQALRAKSDGGARDGDEAAPTSSVAGLTITHEMYSTVAYRIVLHLRRNPTVELEGERQEDIVQWHLEQVRDELGDEEALEKQAVLVRGVIERMIHKDGMLEIVSAEEEVSKEKGADEEEEEELVDEAAATAARVRRLNERVLRARPDFAVPGF